MPADKTVDFVVMVVVFGMLAAGLGSWLLGWVVKQYDVLMSRVKEAPAQSLPSSQETDARQTRDAPALPRMKAEELLTLYRLMRGAGIKREDAQAACAACGLPFNNNVWARADPPPPARITPVAGRPTDADFPYQPIDN